MPLTYQTKGILSPRQAEAVYWGAMGKSVEETALIEGIAHRTAKKHREDALHKLDANNLPMAITISFERGILKHMACVGLVVLGSWQAVSEQGHQFTRTRSAGRSARVTRTGKREHNLLDGDLYLIDADGNTQLV